MYVDYEFYKDIWGGLVPENIFPRLEIQARSTMDYYTFNRLKGVKNISEDVKFAMCELIEYQNKLDQQGGKEIASEKVGSHSITYADTGKEGRDLVKRKQRDIVQKYLGHSGLMYRGGWECENQYRYNDIQ